MFIFATTSLYRSPQIRARRHESFYAVCSLARWLVFPDANASPASLPEELTCFDVTNPVHLNLVEPEGRVPTRVSSMLRASVPKAAVDEHRDLGSREDNVGLTP